ncbi:MAG: pilus assembly protein [Proteobacteria bacterium]|nr:pilus assembly protein [Pseudomonadota bacterium]
MSNRREHGRPRRFLRNRDGAVALEFAAIAPLLFGILLAILETAAIYLRSTALDAGVEEAKRLTFTGQIAAEGNADKQIAKFKEAFCNQADWIINCADVKFDVRAFKTFGAAAMPVPVVDGVFDPSRVAFDPGKPCEIVVIRAYLEIPTMTGMIRKDVSGLKSGNILLAASAAFKNEPYGAC